MPEDSGMGLLPPLIDVTNAEELMALLGGALSCHYLKLSLSSLVGVAMDTKWYRGLGQCFKDCIVLEWVRQKLS